MWAGGTERKQYFDTFLIILDIEGHAVIDDIRFLLLLADAESNPGPDVTAVLAELQKLTTRQSKLISEVTDLKNKVLTTEQTLIAVSQCLTRLESHYQSLTSIGTNIDSLRADTVQTAGLVCSLEARLNDAENHLHRNNIIFYGIPETNTKETSAQSEQLTIDLYRSHLNTNIDPKEIDHPHRFGKFTQNRFRPIIVKFTSHKAKCPILSCDRKFNGTDYRMGENFSSVIHIVQKRLHAFVKCKSIPFSLRFKTLFIRSQHYTSDASSQMVKESTT